MRHLRLLLTAAILTAVSGTMAQDAPKEPTREELEKKFADDLSGAVLTGQFTMTGREDKPPAAEKYTITSAKKLHGDFWVITARVQYGDHDVTAPMPVKVLWAGDTPVITLTDLTIPGLGTYTARVLFYEGRYAGTWSHGPVGGSLWGKYAKPQQ